MTKINESDQNLTEFASNCLPHRSPTHDPLIITSMDRKPSIASLMLARVAVGSEGGVGGGSGGGGGRSEIPNYLG